MTSPALLTTASALLDWVFPPFCTGCGGASPSADRYRLCTRCEASLPWLAGPLCATCGIPLPKGSFGSCRACLRHPPLYRGGRSALRYDDPVRTVILRWKYRGIHAYAPVVRGWMRTFANRLPSARYASLDALVPIPLHPKRLAWRGFNQARELALGLSTELELPIWEGLLIRQRHTPPQQRRQTPAERWANLEGAFVVTDPELVKGRAFCLVDDVATTGATLASAARGLRESGARTVTFCTLARQTIDSP